MVVVQGCVNLLRYTEIGPPCDANPVEVWCRRNYKPSLDSLVLAHVA
jgi:hypothetical protein